MEFNYSQISLQRLIFSRRDFNPLKIHYYIRYNTRSEEKHVRPVPWPESDFVESIFQ